MFAGYGSSGKIPSAGKRFKSGLRLALPRLSPGNFLCDDNNQPVLVDPAVYYGHRSMDLAMTTLFGGFNSAFYQAYDHHYRLPPDYRRQWEIANLYPLLIHLNLFGSSYLPNILQIIQRF